MWLVFILTTLLGTALAQVQPPKLKGGARSAQQQHSAALRATGLKVHSKYCSNPAHAESFVCIKHNMRADLVKASKDDQLKIAEDQARKLGNFTAADRRASKEHLAKETCVDPVNKELLMCKRAALVKKLGPKAFARFKHMAKGFGRVKTAGMTVRGKA